MSFTQTEKPWDFSQVFRVIDTLSNKNTLAAPSQRDPLLRTVSSPHNVTQLGQHQAQSLASTSTRGLGDFAQIWQYLGSPVDIPSPKILPAPDASPTLEKRVPEKIEYTSDGAIYLTPMGKKSKAIQWRDEAADGALTDIAPSKSENEEEEERLSKKQRYKRNKKAREEKAKAETVRKAHSDYESEAEIQNIKPTPARKASAHNLQDLAKSKIPDTPNGRYNFRSRNAQGLVVSSSTPGKEEKEPSKPAEVTAPIAVPESKKTAVPKKAAQPTLQTPAGLVTPDVRGRQQSMPAVASISTPATKTEKKEWPVANPLGAKAKPFVPASVQPTRKAAATEKNHVPSSDPAVTYVQQTPTRSGRTVIAPKIIRSGDDRHWAFLLKLIHDFYQDRGSLIRPANLSNHSNDPKGIHVFVDASNIFIGFHDQLKRARNIPQHVRVPHVNMSFDALALLMERRRPVAKRVLAGSFPHVPAFDVAREIGYECSILDKVWKARELTERQRFFQEKDEKARRRRSGFSSDHNDDSAKGDAYAAGGGGSGSETTGPNTATAAAPTHAPEKFVEQGVDEILHLKILESVVDVETPGTMVLATGDAAQAEYSQGFMVMVERALKKGWSVELVSWSRNISSMYRRDKFRRQWGDRFRIVELDDYAEELLDM